jgi:hypothetical protein
LPCPLIEKVMQIHPEVGVKGEARRGDDMIIAGLIPQGRVVVHTHALLGNTDTRGGDWPRMQTQEPHHTYCGQTPYATSPRPPFSLWSTHGDLHSLL